MFNLFETAKQFKSTVHGIFRKRIFEKMQCSVDVNCFAVSNRLNTTLRLLPSLDFLPTGFIFLYFLADQNFSRSCVYQQHKFFFSAVPCIIVFSKKQPIM